jgi:hypothetical protein
MILGGFGFGGFGAHIAVDFSNLTPSKTLFSESSGFVMEAVSGKEHELKELFGSYDLKLVLLGKSGGDSLRITHHKKDIATISVTEMKEAWNNGFGEALR